MDASLNFNQSSIAAAVQRSLSEPLPETYDPRVWDADGYEAMKSNRALIAQLSQMTPEQMKALPKEVQEEIRQRLFSGMAQVQASRERVEEKNKQELIELSQKLMPTVDYSSVEAHAPDPNNPQALMEHLHPHWRQLAEQDAGTTDGNVQPGRPPGQGHIDWSAEAINQTVLYGKNTGAVTQELHNDAARVAKVILGVDPAMSAEELAAQPAKEVPFELIQAAVQQRFRPSEGLIKQFTGLTSSILKADNLKHQVDFLVNGLMAIQTMETVGTPPVTHRQMIEELWSKHDVPGHALKYSTQDLRKKYDEVNLAMYQPGHHEVKFRSRRTFKVESDGAGVTTHKELHKKSSWSRFKERTLKYAGPVFTVMSFMWFCPPVAIVGAIGSAAVGAYQAYKNKDWMGVALSIAGGVAGAAGAAYAGAAKAAGAGAAKATIAATKFGRFTGETLKNIQSWARVAQGAGSAYKAANDGNWKGALAGVASAAAGYAGTAAGAASNWANGAAEWANRGTQAIQAWDAGRRGDYLGALSIGAGIAAGLNSTGEKADKWLTKASIGARGVRAAEIAIEQKDYVGAAAALADAYGSAKGIDSDEIGENGERIQKFARGLAGLGAAQKLIESGDYVRAAAALASAGESFHWISENRKWEKENKDELSQGLEPSSPSPEYRTAERLGRASELILQLDASHQYIKNGDYAGAAAALAGIREIYPNGKLPKKLDRAIAILQQSKTVDTLVDEGRYLEAASTLAAVAATFTENDHRRDATTALALKLRLMGTLRHEAGPEEVAAVGHALSEVLGRMVGDTSRETIRETERIEAALRNGWSEVADFQSLKQALAQGDYRAAQRSRIDVGGQLPGLDKKLDAMADLQLLVYRGNHEHAAKAARRLAVYAEGPARQAILQAADEMVAARRSRDTAAIETAAGRLNQIHRFFAQQIFGQIEAIERRLAGAA